MISFRLQTCGISTNTANNKRMVYENLSVQSSVTQSSAFYSWNTWVKATFTTKNGWNELFHPFANANTYLDVGGLGLLSSFPSSKYSESGLTQPFRLLLSHLFLFLQLPVFKPFSDNDSFHATNSFF